MSAPQSLLDLARIETDYELDVATAERTPTVSYEDVTALVDAVRAALPVVDVPFGQINPRQFYALREACRPFRREQ